MRNLIRITFLIFICSCVTKPNDIYNELPIDTKLNFEFLRKTESIVKVKDYYVLLYDLENNGRNILHFPHLVFFDEKLNHISSSYFASPWISKIKGDTIFANTTERLKDKSNSFRNDIPEKLHIKYHKYKTKSGPIQGGGLTDTTLVGIEYDNKSNLVSLLFDDKNKSLKYQKISLNNIKYSYQNREIMIKISDNDVRVDIKYFRINEELLNDFLLAVLNKPNSADLL